MLIISFTAVGLNLKTGANVAVKIIDAAKTIEGSIMKSIKIMQTLDHPHVMKVYDSFTSSDGKVYVVMEYINGGDLFEALCKHGKYEEDEGRKLFQQLIAGLCHCHSRKVAHRDLKPENLLLDARNRLKIADFGLSTYMPDGYFMHTTCGSQNYASPELVSSMYF